jgi:hypothetical protein
LVTDSIRTSVADSPSSVRNRSMFVIFRVFIFFATCLLVCVSKIS